MSDSSRGDLDSGSVIIPEVTKTRIKVDRIMNSRKTIKNIFKPLQYLGRGGYSVTYKGEI